jgi:F0F1-type ATP synthase membrane subunit c/vacuolar-type H+-ATPase subunit K
MSSTPRPLPDAKYKQRITLWLAILFSVAMYFVVVRMVQPQGVKDNPALVNILLIAAASLVVASFLAESALRTLAREKNNAQLEQAAYIVALVLCESAALFGVVIWFVTGSSRYYLLLLIGFAGILLHYPRRDEPDRPSK